MAQRGQTEGRGEEALNERGPIKLFVAGWVLILAGLVFPPIAFIGAWLAIAAMVWGGYVLIFNKGRDKGIEEANRDKGPPDAAG